MKRGQKIVATRLIRSQRTGAILPREGTVLSELENLGRKLILVDFGTGTEEYVFSDEIEPLEDSVQCENNYDVTFG